MPHATPSPARRLIDAVPVWDHHACMPLRPLDPSFLPQLARHKAAGFDAVTVNIGFGEQGPEEHLRMIAALRHWLMARPDEYLLLLEADDKLGKDDKKDAKANAAWYAGPMAAQRAHEPRKASASTPTFSREPPSGVGLSRGRYAGPGPTWSCASTTAAAPRENSSAFACATSSSWSPFGA
jgi:hypothetical protein